MNGDIPDNKLRFPWGLLAAVVFAVGIQFTAGILIYRNTANWSDRAAFGEMFGVVSCLFSGMAFAGIVYTISIQREELNLQRQELILTREELRRSAEAHEKQMMMQSVREIISGMDDQKVHDARNFIYKNYAIFWKVAEDPGKLGLVPDDAYETACVVSNSFDNVGVFVSEGLIPKDIVLKNFGSSIARSWIALAPFIKALRKSRYDHNYECFFEDLAMDAIDRLGEDAVVSMLKAWGKGKR